MQTLVQDLQYAARTLRKTPGFALAATIVLALGIGANTAIFSVVNTVLLKSLPFPNPDTLMDVWHVPPPQQFPGMKAFAVSAGNYRDWARENDVFQGIALYTGGSFNLTGHGLPKSLNVTRASANVFSVLQTPPELGRGFTADEDQPGKDNVVVLSHNFWKAQFASDPQIVGKTIELNGTAFTVIGVMPTSFDFPVSTNADSATQIYLPLGLTDAEWAVRGEHHFGTVARLKPGVTIQRAQAEMDTISRRLAEAYPVDNKGWGAIVLPMREDVVGDIRPALLVLLGAVAFVLLIACANIANLVLARVLSRSKEIAIRSALGASRARVLRQLMAETMLLALVGGTLGLLVADAGIKTIVHMVASQLPRAADIGLNGTVLAFTLLISIITGLLAGLLPALRSSRANINDALKQGHNRTDADAGHGRTRNVLVISEVALSLMLMIGAGLMIRTLWKLHSVDPGFDPHNVITMEVRVPQGQFPNPEAQIAFFDQALQGARSVPGVQTAGVIDDLPLNPDGSHQPIAIEGRPVVPMAEQPEVDVRLISPGYVETMHIPLLRGRLLRESDNASSQGAILISESLAKKFWPNEDALGKRLTMTFAPDKVREVVGILRDVKLNGLNDRDPVPTLYEALNQLSVPALGGWRSFGLTLVARTSMAPTNAISGLTEAVHKLNPDIPIQSIATMDQLTSDSLAQQRFNMLLLASFAGLALLLAAIGIYSVLAYSVRRRVREIGIRMALGAQIGDVLRLIVVEGMKPTLIGLGIGLAGALALGHVLSSLLYGVNARDAATFASVSIVLAGVGLLASVIPAYRASRNEPVKTLRDE